ncbi:hypothetical protein BURPS1710b_1125 [Burkholderia pseudomallei 1710b]|uniref:Uncharacterized protein n=1 Tax=Burkholderia pseudomallei (strain 1710b) TaxID=320372 RepID=Q3JV66_BURP1|nr:hypothetical protein BURPS1710b_1125 [Burkholderia pseudomallei 1710b]
MLGGEHARGERIGIVARDDGHGRLRDDRAAVELRNHEVDGCAVQRDARVERLLMRMNALEARQQRRMDVEHPPLIFGDERRRENAHEAGEHDEIGGEAVDFGGERRIEAVAAVERAVVDDGRRDAVRRREFEAGRAQPVGNHGGDLGGPAFARAGAYDGLHVAAAAGNQDDKFFHPRILPFGPAVSGILSRPAARTFIISCFAASGRAFPHAVTRYRESLPRPAQRREPRPVRADDRQLRRCPSRPPGPARARARGGGRARAARVRDDVRAASARVLQSGERAAAHRDAARQARGAARARRRPRGRRALQPYVREPVARGVRRTHARPRAAHPLDHGRRRLLLRREARGRFRVAEGGGRALRLRGRADGNARRRRWRAHFEFRRARRARGGRSRRRRARARPRLCDQRPRRARAEARPRPRLPDAEPADRSQAPGPVGHLRRARARPRARAAAGRREPRRAADRRRFRPRAARSAPARLARRCIRQARSRRIPEEAARRGEIRRSRNALARDRAGRRRHARVLRRARSRAGQPRDRLRDVGHRPN